VPPAPPRAEPESGAHPTSCGASNWSPRRCSCWRCRSRTPERCCRACTGRRERSAERSRAAGHGRSQRNRRNHPTVVAGSTTVPETSHARPTPCVVCVGERLWRRDCWDRARNQPKADQRTIAVGQHPRCVAGQSPTIGGIRTRFPTWRFSRAPLREGDVAKRIGALKQRADIGAFDVGDDVGKHVYIRPDRERAA